MPTSHVGRGRTTNTFVVRVLETDDKGWIGVITHVQSGRTTKFKGFIQAVRFMDSFIEGPSGASINFETLEGRDPGHGTRQGV